MWSHTCTCDLLQRLCVPSPHTHWPLCDLKVHTGIFPQFPSVWFSNPVLSAIIIASVHAWYSTFLWLASCGWVGKPEPLSPVFSLCRSFSGSSYLLAWVQKCRQHVCFLTHAHSKLCPCLPSLIFLVYSKFTSLSISWNPLLPKSKGTF